MLKELINAISGSAATVAFSNPTGYGINSVPTKSLFKNFFNNLMASLNATPGAIFPGTPAGFGGTQIQPQSPYRNFQGQFPGQLPMQFQGPYANSNFLEEYKKTNRAVPPGPIIPGAVVVNSANQIPPPIQQGAYLPAQSLAGANYPPPSLAGFAGQSGFNGNSQGGYGNLLQGQLSALPYGVGQGSGIGKILNLFIMPIFGLFSAVKSLFDIRHDINMLNPLQVDKENGRYSQYGEFLDETALNEEGSFDEYSDFEPNSEGFIKGDRQDIESNLDFSKLAESASY